MNGLKARFNIVIEFSGLWAWAIAYTSVLSYVWRTRPAPNYLSKERAMERDGGCSTALPKTATTQQNFSRERRVYLTRRSCRIGHQYRNREFEIAVRTLWSDTRGKFEYLYDESILAVFAESCPSTSNSLSNPALRFHSNYRFFSNVINEFVK